uniref:Small ribosomal subunit protein uS10 n=1 Tax=Stygiella incarcerata TaxID=1712417 RepID=A0A192ZII2_9EUKA|nr:40S ribosomal protein S20-1 [Stygiella incarcerata]|eukprot:TRINITY_DN1606_c0_g1_i2.p1 TRINITY_DN1606_c0_g1~~TRINITY_DN1606_c0_g1_i2.p1  ORF type:complete len:122 (-),score=19.65 TRINITY_DN1606_c0_g1_i2:217-582(-)
MSVPKKVEPTTGEADRKIRITLTSTEVTGLEGVCSSIIKSAKKKQLKVKGPVRMPTKTLRITTRKSPCGNGTNTFDRFEMRVHKRVIDMYSTPSVVKEVADVRLPKGVEIEVTLTKKTESA